MIKIERINFDKLIKKEEYGKIIAIAEFKIIQLINNQNEIIDWIKKVEGQSIKRGIEKDKVWNCHAGVQHEVGCPHLEWSEEELSVAKNRGKLKDYVLDELINKKINKKI